MKQPLQLSLDSFDPDSPLPCKSAPGLNGHKKNCLPCVHSLRRRGRIFCSLFRKPMTKGQKYSLKEWKSVRNLVLERDGHKCVICSVGDGLHVHHVDRDTTNDDLSNLVTLCNGCHARAHAELHMPDGSEQVMRVIEYYRKQCEPGKEADT